MELTGEVILDNETMNELREQIRKEVIEEIKSNGNYMSEIEIFLKDCRYDCFMGLIKDTIKTVVDKTDKDEIHWDSDKRLYKKLLMIDELLKI